MNDKAEMIHNNMVALAKSKNAKMRSKMLKMIMPMLSRENGQKLAEAIYKKNASQFNIIWEKIKKEVDKKLESNSSAEVTIIPDIDEAYELLTESMSISTSSNNKLEGNTLIPRKARQLAMEGRTFLEHAGDIFELRVLSSDFKVENSIQCPTVDMIAEVTKLVPDTTDEQPFRIELSGEEVSDTFLDLIVQANVHLNDRSKN